MHLQVMTNDEEKVKSWLSDGLDPNSRNDDHKTPLTCALEDVISNGPRLLDMVCILLENGGKSEEKELLQSAFLYVISENHARATELLVKILDPNFRDERGKTALMLAAENFSDKTIRVLLDAEGIDVNIKDKSNKTVFDLFKFESATDIAMAASVLELFLLKKVITKRQYWNAKERIPADIMSQALINLSLRPGGDDAIKYALSLGYDLKDALTAAAVAGQIPEANALVKAKPSCGLSALIDSAKNNNVIAVRGLLCVQGIAVNNEDKEGFTALICASMNGHDEVVKLLQEAKGIDVNSRNKILLQETGNWLSRTSQAVMGLFRKKDDHKDDYVEDATALIWASREGRLEVVKLLLEDEGVDRNATDKDGKTALISASEEGKIEVVELLLEAEGVDMKAADKSGKTALIWAVEKGHLKVAMLLVKKSTEVGYDYLNMRDINGTNALTHAANSGCLEIVELLVGMPDVRMNDQNDVNDTALICATRKQYVNIAASLLGREDTDPLLKDSRGNTAFDLAKFTKDSQSVLELFFKRKARFSWSVTIWWSGVRNNIPVEIVTGALVTFARESKKAAVKHVLSLGYDIMAALKQIAEDGFIAGVKTFLDESRDKCLLVLGELVKKGLSNSVATILAADKGNKDKRKTKLLIEAIKDKADPKKEEDHEEIVRSFVEYGTNPCENVSIGGHTALSAAVSYDKLGMVKFLAFHTISNNFNEASATFKKTLSSAGWAWYSNTSYKFLASVKAMHDADKSLLSDDLYTWAEAGKHEELVNFLKGLGYNEAYEKIGRTVLTNAAYMGNVEAIQNLLRLPGLPEKVNARDKNKDTALILAASKGNDLVVENLLKVEGIDVNAQCKDGSSALTCAARNGHAKVVGHLLKVEKIDLNVKNEHGNTPLIAATANGHNDIANILIQMPAVDINSKNNRSMTAFDMFDFTDIGHSAVLELFLVREAGTTERKYSNTEGRIPDDIMVQALISLSLKPHSSGAIAYAVSLGYSLDTALKVVAKQNNMDAVRALATEDRAAASRLLVVAAENGNIALVKNLLAVPGIDINVQNEHGNTPLIAATANGHNDIANILIQMQGIDIYTRNKQGQTALDLFKFVSVEDSALLEAFLRLYKDSGKKIPDGAMIISQKISLLAGRVSAATLKGSSAYLYTEFSSMPKFIWVESLRKLAKSIMQNHGWNPYMQMRMLMLRQNLGPYFSAVPFTVRTKILSFLTRGDIDIREPVAVLPVANQEMAADVIGRMSRGGSIAASSDSGESVDMDSLDLGGSGMAEVSAPGNM